MPPRSRDDDDDDFDDDRPRRRRDWDDDDDDDDFDDRPRRRKRKKRSDPGLTGGQIALFALLFLPIPAVNALVSSVLYYVWKADHPRCANQINMLGFIVFGFQIVGICLLGALIGGAR